LPGKRKFLTGQVFGHLKVLKEVHSEKYGKAWLVECDCVNKTQQEVDTTRLTSGIKQHCGCLKVYKKRSEIKLPSEYINKTKICNQCGIEKVYGDFYSTEYINSENIQIYKFDSRCTECVKENSKNRILNNREDHLKALKINNAREETKEKVRICGKRYRSGEKYVAWKDKNAYRFKIYSDKHRVHDITEEEWRGCLIAFNNTCAYCGLPIEEHIIKRNGKYIIMKFHKEHVDDKGYNDLRNGVPSCRSCNSSKHTSSLEEWYFKQKFFSMDRYIKILWWTNEEYKDYIEEKPPYRIVKKKNDDNNKFHHELWSVDEMRNFIEIITTGIKKEDINIYIANNNL